MSISQGQKLLLASSGLIFEKIDIGSYFDISLADAQILWITTASHKVSSTDYLVRHTERVKRLGLNYTELDIKDKSYSEIQNALSGVDIVHVEGGNTFYLLQMIRETGFDRLLREQINNGLKYIGTSAGSYIMGPSIIPATWSGKEQYGVTDLTGLNFVPFVIKAHYTTDKRKEWIRYAQELPYPLKMLTDEQAIFVDGDSYILVGAGDEVIIK